MKCKMLEGKTALITGGSRGIGRAIALRMAQEGANIAVVYAGNADMARETQALVEAEGVVCKTYCCDVSDFAETKALTEDVIRAFDGIDILVNNAGIVRDALVLSMKEEDFDRVLDVNLKGAFHMTKHLYSHFMKKRAGKVINITSVVGIAGSAGQANYASAKAGLIGLTKSVAKELAGRRVNCNAIAPGYIETDMTDNLPDRVKEKIFEMIPMKRIGLGEDIANMAAFLASDYASYITGEVIKIDGGLLM